LDGGEAIQGSFMMRSLWIAPCGAGFSGARVRAPPHKDLDCFVTSFLAMTNCVFYSRINCSCGQWLTQASFTRLPWGGMPPGLAFLGWIGNSAAPARSALVG